MDFLAANHVCIVGLCGQVHHAVIFAIAQLSCTKRLLVLGFRHCSYAKILQLLKLESLEARHVKADLVLYYKTVHGHVHTDNKKAVLSQRCPRDAQSDNMHMV